MAVFWFGLVWFQCLVVCLLCFCYSNRLYTHISSRVLTFTRDLLSTWTLSFLLLPSKHQFVSNLLLKPQPNPSPHPPPPASYKQSSPGKLPCWVLQLHIALPTSQHLSPSIGSPFGVALPKHLCVSWGEGAYLNCSQLYPRACHIVDAHQNIC